MKKTIKKLIKSIILRFPSKFEKASIDPNASDILIKNIDHFIEFQGSDQSGPDFAWYEFSKGLVKELRAPGAIDNFLRSPTILKTMNEVFLWNIVKEYFYVIRYLKQEGYNLSKILLENSIGNQVPFFLNRKTSANLIHHVFHIVEFMKFSEGKIHQFSDVYEIGAGYGSMARVVKKFGFEGNYHIYDLELFCELQKFYLSSLNIFPETQISWNCDASQDNVKKNSLMIATWSLSEINIDTRRKYQRLLAGCDYFLIGFRDTFEGVDNLEYFQNLVEIRPDLEFQIKKIKGIKNSYYLFAKPKF